MPRRLSLIPRLRQACRRDHRGPGAAAGALCGHPSSFPGATGALQGPGPRFDLNRVYLSGILIAEPQPDKGRDGEPVTLLLIAFPAPDSVETRERLEVASCEVEVPEQVVEGHREELRAGGSTSSPANSVAAAGSSPLKFTRGRRRSP